MISLWIPGFSAALLIAFGPLAGRLRPLPPALQMLSGICGGVLALVGVLLHPQVWPGLWPSLLVVLCYVVSLYPNDDWRRRFRLPVMLAWMALLVLLVGRIYAGATGLAEPISGEAPQETGGQTALAGSALIHLLLWVAATVAVWLATLQSALLLHHHRRIKKGLSLPSDARLPLDEMSRLLTVLASAGLLSMTLALGYSYWWGLSGIADDISVLKQALATVVWLLLAALLVSHWFFGLRSYLMAGFMLGAFGTLALGLAWGISIG